MKGYTYILECNDGAYYIGSTKNFENRFWQHSHGKVKFTKNKLPLIVKMIEEYESYSLAFKREKQLKSWKKRVAVERLFNQK